MIPWVLDTKHTHIKSTDSTWQGDAYADQGSENKAGTQEHNFNFRHREKSSVLRGKSTEVTAQIPYWLKNC